MTLSDLAIKRRVFAWMLMASLIIFGGISFMRMGVSQLPDVDFPVVTVSLSLLGAAPEIMETQVVDTVEDAVMSIQGVRDVTSTSFEGNATVTIEFDLNRDIDAALQEVQTKVIQAQRTLPREMDPPVITKTNPDDQPIMWLALSSTSNLPLRDLMIYVRDVLKDRFTTVPGVGEIVLGGYVEPNMRIWVSADALEKYYLSVSDVVTAIQNEHSEPPSGYLSQGAKESNVRTLGEAHTAEQFRDIVINFRGGTPNYIPIRLDQVAQVEAGLADIRRISRTQGRPAVGLGIRKQRGSNAVAVADGVLKRVKEVQPTLPPGMQLGVNFDSTEFIKESVGELNLTLVLSAVLTALVCWLFLGSWSSTLNVILAIPTSIVGTFIVLYFAGFTLNTFTLLGLSLAIGIVVDDAIMVLENIVRHRESGQNRLEAAIWGAREITFAAVAASVAVVAIFLPVAFMQGVIGKFFLQFGVTLTVAVALSLLEALTLTPMRCASFLNVAPRTTRLGRGVEAAFEWMSRFYKKTLTVILDHRWKVVLGSLVFFAISFALSGAINKEFSPPQDQSMFLAKLQTPVGSSIEYTDSRFKLAEAFLMKQPEVKRYYSAVGGFQGGEINSGMIFVTLKPPDERKRTQQQFMDYTRDELNKIPNVEATMQDLSLRGFTASRGFPIEFVVTGPDWEKLGVYAKQIMAELRKSGMVTDLDTDFEEGKPELRVIPDRQKAASRGVPIASIGQVISSLIGGIVVSQYSEGGHRYDVRLKLQLADVGGHADLTNLLVRNARGELVQLNTVVNTETKPTLQQISRRNRQRAISVFGNVAKGKSQQAALDAVNQIAAKTLPPGYSVVFSGSTQTFKESFQGLLFVLLLGIVVSYMVLASQFDSFIDPVTVLMALPFSVSGAFVALWMSRQSINIYSLIGLILLMGIVKKNSILLVDFTNQIRTRNQRKEHGGDSTNEVHVASASVTSSREAHVHAVGEARTHAVAEVRTALLEACPLRLRPILMTSIATIAGAVPPALAIGPGAETRVPMAVAVIGGVLVSTLLTLFVVPCVYSLFSRFHREKPYDAIAAIEAASRAA